MPEVEKSAQKSHENILKLLKDAGILTEPAESSFGKRRIEAE